MANFMSLDTYYKNISINYKPPIHTSITKLDYNNLTHNWEVFEDLILDIVRKIEGDNLDIDLYKTRGAKQHGIDIYMFDENHDYEKVFQCKRYKKFTKTSLDKAVAVFNEGVFANDVKEFFIVTSVDVKPRISEIRAYKKKFKESGIKFEVWGTATLDKFLVKMPKIVHRFFDGNEFPAQHVKLFCGEEHLRNLEYIGIEKHYYEFNTEYIERVCDKTTNPKESQGFGWPMNITFKECIEQNPEPLRILLRSSPGVGKTTELDYIANLLSKGELCPERYPFRYYLKNYSFGNIRARLSETYPNWEFIRNKLFLILDGFDEIPETSQRSFKQEIRELIELNPKVSVVISVRHNSTPDGLGDFEYIELLRLDDHQIREYLRSKLKNKSDSAIRLFLSNCRELKIQEILKNPFELSCLVDVFNDQSQLPRNKFDLLLKVREQRLSDEKNKDRFIGLIERKVHNTLLCKLSLVLMLLDRQGINETDLLEFSLSGEEIEIFRNSPFIHYSEEDISFVHNNFKEFFLAEALNKLTLDQIKNLICFQERETLKPKWKNGLGFFLASGKNEDIISSLISFILEKDALYIVGIERERISFSKRFIFFKEVLSDLISYFPKNVYFEELFDFVEINERPDVLHFILKEILENNNVLNGLYFLKSLSNPFHLEPEIKNAFKQILKKPHHEPRVHEYAIEILHELELLDEVILKHIFASRPSFTNVHVRAAVLRHLNSKGLIPEYLDFAFATIRLKESQPKSDVYSSFWYIFDGLKKTDNIVHIEQILNETQKLFADNYTQWLNGQKEFITSLFETLKKLGKDITLRDAIIRTITIRKNHELTDFWLLPCFNYLKESGYAEFTFWKLWKKYELKVWWLGQGFQLLVSNKTIEKMTEKLKYSRNREEEALRFIHILGTAQEKLFIDKVNSIDFLGLNLDLRKPYVDTYQKDAKEEITLLLNKSEFLKNLERIFFSKGKELTIDQLNNLSFYEYSDRRSIAWGLLQKKSKENNGKITFQELVEHFDKKDSWTDFVRFELGRIAINSKDLLSNNQLDYFKSLVLDLLPLDFKNARWMKNKVWRYNTNEFNFCIYYTHIRPKIDKEIILQMLSFDNSGIHDYFKKDDKKQLTDIIREELNDDGKLVNQVLQNLKEGIDYPNTVGTHFRLCEELKIYAALELLVEYLKNERLGFWSMEKGIEIYLELGGSITEFRNIPWIFDSEKPWHWLVIKKLYNKDLFKDQIISKLEELPSYGENNKYLATARDLLLKSKSTKGLDLLILTVQISQSHQFRGNEELESLLAGYSIGESEFIFKAIYEKASKNTGAFNDLMDFFIGSAIKTALSHHSFYKIVLSLFSKNKDEYHIRSYEEKFKNEYLMKKVEFNSITEVIKHLQEELAI